MSIQRIKLRQIADARSGDKGTSSNIGILAHSEKDYDFLKAYLTGDRVQSYFKAMGVAAVERYELPNLLALNFILKGVLGEGGSCSLRLDPQGKALGQVLLEMPIDVTTELFPLPTSELVHLEHPHAGVCLLTLKRGIKHNALNIEMLEALCAHLQRATLDQNLRVLILAAEGPSFCAGMDLKDATDPDKVDRSASLIAQMFGLLSEASFVTIAAAQGVAAGGGAGLLSLCDLVVAADNLKISYPETRHGLVAAQVAPLLLRLVPRHIVNELLLCGESFYAQKALSVGLVNRVVAMQDLIAEAMRMASAVCHSAPNAIKQTKRLLRELESRSFSEELAITLPYHHASRASSEAKEGTDAFREKRPPSWVPSTALSR